MSEGRFLNTLKRIMIGRSDVTVQKHSSLGYKSTEQFEMSVAQTYKFRVPLNWTAHHSLFNRNLLTVKYSS